MPYIGSKPSTSFVSMSKQDLTGSSGGSVTLSHAVANANEVALYINNVRQEPIESYTVSGSTLSFNGYTVSASDDIYVIFLGKAMQTIVPPDGSVTSAKLDTNIAVSGNLTVSGAFTSQGIDDNADATAITIDSSENVAFSGNISVNNKVQGASGESLTIESQSGGAVIFNSNGATERMRITTEGIIKAGNLNEKLGGGTNFVSLSSNGYASLRVRRGADGGNAVQFFGFSSNTTPVGSIDTGSSSTSYLTSSDHRLKENVVDMTDATTRLKQLQPKRFNFIVDADTTVDGFLAHEVQSVVPEAITGTHNEVDDDGNPVYQGIDQSKLVPLLVKTIQELEARITALENK